MHCSVFIRTVGDGAFSFLYNGSTHFALGNAFKPWSSTVSKHVLIFKCMKSLIALGFFPMLLNVFAGLRPLP